MIIKNILLIILTIILVYSCKKKNNEIQYSTNSVNQTLLSKYYFKLGSYWVYKNQSNTVDSIILISLENGYTYIPCPHGCPDGIQTRDEFYKLNFKSVQNNITFNYYFMSDYIKFNGGGDYSEKGQPMFLYNKELGYTFNGASVVGKIDTMTVFGKQYQNITKIKISSKNQYQKEFLFDTYLYFSDNYGLIKKEINDTVQGNQTWNLLRYSLIQ